MNLRNSVSLPFFFSSESTHDPKQTLNLIIMNPKGSFIPIELSILKGKHDLFWML